MLRRYLFRKEIYEEKMQGSLSVNIGIHVIDHNL